MLLGHFVLRLGLDQRNRRLVQLLAWESALLEENAAAVINLLLRVVRFLRRLQIKCSLLPFFRQSGRGLKPVGRLRLFVRALVLDLGSGEIAVLQHGEDLAALHTTAAIHVKRSYWRDDFRSDGRLVARKQNSFSADDLLDCAALRDCGLHRDHRFGFLWLLRTGHQHCKDRDEKQ